MKTRILVTTVVLVLAATAAGISAEAEKKVAPSFRPGAKVDLAITLKAPKQWEINYQMPLTFAFDPEYLEEAPFTVEEESLSVKLESYVPELTVVIPVKLNKGLKDGKLNIPLPVSFSICNEVTDFCAFAQETVTVPVEVKAVAEPDTKNQALATGQVEHSHLLSIP